MTEELTRIDQLILDVLLDDIESPADILRLMNNPEADYMQENLRRPFSEREIEQGLSALLERRFVEALCYSDRTSQLEELRQLDRPIRDCWFRLTPRGRQEVLKAS